MSKLLLIVILIIVIAAIGLLVARNRPDSLPADSDEGSVDELLAGADHDVSPPLSDIATTTAMAGSIHPEPDPVDEPLPEPEPVVEPVPPVEPEPVVEPVPPVVPEPEPVIEPDPEPVGAVHGDPLAAAGEQAALADEEPPLPDEVSTPTEEGEVPAEDLDPHAGWETEDDTTVHADPESGLYHTPDSPGYKIGSDGVVFASEEEAEAAGFTRWDEPR
jgi:hypothetical protein